MEETKQLAAYLHSLRYAHLPQEAVEAAKAAMLDFIGVALAGAETPPAQIYDRYVEKTSGRQEEKGAVLLRKGLPGAHYKDAVEQNAVYGHALDFDDVHNGSITHLGVLTIPVALALGAKLGSSGEDVLTAVIAGYEVGARIGEAINPSSYAIWHTTGAIGAFAATATAAKLLNLTENELQNALGSAGTQAGGLWEFLKNGSMSKVLHVANANAAGLRAAELAKLGFTGAETILEGKAGFLAAMTPKADAAKLTAGMDGKNLKILQNSLKAYPCCRHAHAGIFAVAQLLREHGVRPEQVESILDETYDVAVTTLDKAAPDNAYAAKFSAQYCLAAMLEDGQVNTASFEEAALADEGRRTLMERVQIAPAAEMNDIMRQDPEIWPHEVTVKLTDGTELKKRVLYPIGDYHNPLSWQQVAEKFRGCAEGLLEKELAEALIARVEKLEQLPHIAALFAF